MLTRDGQTRDPVADSFRIVIPARYGSERLPGKPLRMLAGKPLIAHAWHNAIRSGAKEVVVATDDQRIYDQVKALGGEVTMTSADHCSGTDRIAEVVDTYRWTDDIIVVNLQGDEPGIDDELIGRTVQGLVNNPNAGIATVASSIDSSKDLFDPNVVKVVIRESNMAAYFSRAPIPWVRGWSDKPTLSGELPTIVPFLRHIGLYAYRVGALKEMCNHQPSFLEQAEKLEQLRALSIGIQIFVHITASTPLHGVDTQQDLDTLQQQLSRK